MIATLILRWRFARVLTHLVCYARHRETLDRCRAGIVREFQFKHRYQLSRRSPS